jgi:hypothetical protein
MILSFLMYLAPFFSFLFSSSLKKENLAILAIRHLSHDFMISFSPLFSVTSISWNAFNQRQHRRCDGQATLVPACCGGSPRLQICEPE